MSRTHLALGVLLIAGAGCTTSYRVHVSGFSKLAEPVKQGASICVSADPNAPNPLFAEEIKAKIVTLLSEYGYAPVEAVQSADYRLVFQVGMRSQETVDYMPLYEPYGRFYRGFHPFGHITYVPYAETWYSDWLRMKLSVRAASGQEALVWVGEATMTTGDADLRRAVNYLLVGCIEYFGVDTQEWVTVVLKPDDPRITDIGTDR